MPLYKINFNKKSKKKLDKMSDAIITPIIEAIEGLAENPRPQGCKKLKGRSGYRIRVGNYRIIYEIFDEILLIDVIDLGHRKDIYE
ncbi:MAG: type II toxin-antitoxin system RelE/ParE family toxin [Flavobacterium sp.]|uniref:type II toxin-antitoxin system RelE family toxin n=1 Tax=Flavobacterium sp. TaxID=239 RepID=UPI0022C4647C|nr:type II toxin-antitoxin system RelE/ParE family toxin [Flavobacterium sp.]MCZ8196212.1 type II toxin-antitoxin system RelE/ParE family toxin [Flavobacterium sp.]